MSKIEIPPVPSGFATTEALNERLQQIEDALNDDVLWRSDVGIEPNAMADTLDMGENRIINLLDAVQDSEPVTLRQIDEVVSEAVAGLDLSLGNVVGPVGAADSEVALFDGITGRLLKRGLAFWRILTNTATFADLGNTSATVGQQVRTRGHTVAGVGGALYQAFSGTITNDLGSQINSLTAGIHWKLIERNPTPYQFGYLDGATDCSVAINACTAAFGACYLDGGKTYNLQYQLNAKVLKTLNGGNALLNLTSPTANTRWGGPTSSFGNTAAVLCLGDVGSPLKGVDIQNIDVNCNKLIGASGSVGIKGFMFTRCKDFYQRACSVVNCASYAFWDYDVATTGTTYCSGTRDDCTATDCAVSFEQVNVRGVTLNNCHAYIGPTPLGYTPEFMFHPYGGSDMQVVYNSCTGITDGVCPSVVGALLECKNVTANDCQFINRYDGGVAIQAAVYFESSGGNFGGIAFNNCILRADFFAAVILLPGALGSITAEFSFTDCTIDGKSIGVQFNGTGGYYSFVNCITTGTSIAGGTAFGYNTNAIGAVVQVTGGRATGTGGVSPQASNLSASSFNGTILTPNTSAVPSIKQQKTGIVALENNTSYASKLVSFPVATVDATKVFIYAMAHATGAGTGAAAAALATPMSFLRVDATNYRIYADIAAAGRTIHYVMVEFE